MQAIARRRLSAAARCSAYTISVKPLSVVCNIVPYIYMCMANAFCQKSEFFEYSALGCRGNARAVARKVTAHALYYGREVFAPLGNLFVAHAQV